MNAALINPFVGATTDVFKKMLGCDLARGALYLKETHSAQHDISGLVEISGAATGTVILSLSRAAALGAAGALLGETRPSIDMDVIDAIGELTNMVAGAATSDFGHVGVNIGLPRVVVGKSQPVTFPPDSVPMCIPFQSLWGDITVELGLVGA